LLKWQSQPARRSRSWELTLKNQRIASAFRIKKTPSLKTDLEDGEWWEVVWADAVNQASTETGLVDFPETCPWTMDEILDQAFFPE
jgi:hypothetical protein